MLESMRNQAQSWISKVILGGIALSFALWGVGDFFTGNQVQTIAEVDGKPIVDSTFRQAYERQLNSYRSLMGKQFSKELVEKLGVKEETIQTLINRKLMLDEAHQMGLAAPEAALLASLHSNPAFQSATGFDANRYRILTRNMGFRTTRDYEDDQRLNLMVNALQKDVVGSAKVSDKDIRENFNSEFEQRVLSAVIVDPASMLKKIKIDETQARNYYEVNLQNYRSPLKVKLTAVEISPTAFATDLIVDAADVKAAYLDRKAEFSKPEQRRASHILVRSDKNADEATRSAAHKKIEAAKARLTAGEAFAAVAKDVSDDVTAKEGGDLGFFARGAMLPEFDGAAFSLAKGEVSDIIESIYGFHIIQIKEIKAAEVTPLKEVYNSLADEIRKEKAGEEAYKLSQDLDDALGMEDSLTAAAATLDLAVTEIGPLSADETLGNILLGSDPSLRVTVFSVLPGEAVTIQELDDGRFVAIEVMDRIEPATLSFADAAAAVYEDARNAEARVQAKSLAEEILSKAGSTTLDQLAQTYGQPKYISKQVRSNGIGDESGWLTPAVLDQAFKTAQGSTITSPIEVSKGFAIVQVKAIVTPAESEFEVQKEPMRLEVEKGKGAVRFARWMATVRNNHDIVIHRNILERF
ncbi:MAG: SurA N-terminal domain-containing protein [Mariprofundaceae bacterium]